MSNLLSAENVTVTVGGGRLGHGQVKRALDGVSLGIGAGSPSIVAIVGESGSGKTTLTRLLLGLMAPTSGAVTYRDKPLSAMRGSERLTFRREVQAIFQDPYAAYNPFYRVDRALISPAIVRKPTARFARHSPRSACGRTRRSAVILTS